MLKISSRTSKRSKNFEVLEQLVQYVNEKKENNFRSLCGKKFKTATAFKEFRNKFPHSSFILGNDEAEISHSVFLNYLGNTQDHYWPESRKTEELIFQTPNINRKSLFVRSLNGVSDNKLRENKWLQ